MEAILEETGVIAGAFAEWRLSPTEQLSKLHGLLSALVNAQPASSLPSSSTFDEFKAWISKGGFASQKRVDVRNMGPSEGNGLVADEHIRY
jgi:hypothetical protein